MASPEGHDTLPTATDPTSVVVSRAALARGASVGRFVVLDPVGGGGMGTVYAAFDPTLDRKVAIKLLHPVLGGHGYVGEAQARLLREAQAMARIAHPNVVPVYEVGTTDDGAVFVAMEIVEGGTATEWLSKRQRGWREVLDLFCEVGEGLAAAHKAGVIHRDFKLDNVLVGEDGRPRVTDFGLARAQWDAPSSGSVPAAMEPSAPSSLPSSPLAATLTRSGAVLGTPGYMAPEQYGSESQIDARADVFAFCATLYRALYGERPFQGDNVHQIAIATVEGRLREPPRDAKVPAKLRRVLLRGLATDPDKRYGGMPQLLSALRAVRASTRRNELVAGAAVLLTVGSVALGFSRSRSPVAAAPVCPDDAAAELAGVWDAPRKEAVSRAFAATGRPYAGDQWQAVEHTLDAYAAAWADGGHQACMATRVRGEQSMQMLELRQACLESRREDLRALVDVLSAADGPVLDKAVVAAHDLPRLDACADVDRLSAAARTPTDPAVREEIRVLEGEIAKARTLRLAGKRTLALEQLRSLEERVSATSSVRLLFEWTYGVARAEERHDEKAAESAYMRAIALAEMGRFDDDKAVAEIDWADFQGSWLGHSVEAHRWFDLARATIVRAGGDGQLQANCDLQEAWSYQYEHKMTEAGRLFAQVLERADFAQQPLEIRASAYSGAGEVAASDGRADEAVANGLLAIGVLEAELGKQHPFLTGFLNNLAMSQLAAGRNADAVTTMSRCLEMFEAQVRRGDIPETSPDLGLAAHSMGEVLTAAGRPGEAVAPLLRARAIYRASHGETNPDVAYADNELAEALRATGRSGEARRWLEEASAIEARSSDVPPAVVAGTLAGRAQLELDRGRTAAGIALAERAMSLVAGGNATARERAGVAEVLERARKMRRR